MKRYLVLWLILWWGTACTSATSAPSLTPTVTPLPTATVTPGSPPPPSPDEFIALVEQRLADDETMPASGQNSEMTLHQFQPTFVFPNNLGSVLQFEIFDIPQDQMELRQVAILLMGAGAGVADQHNIDLQGIEVVFYITEDKPWMAFSLAPPWAPDDISLKPIAPELIEALVEKGVITPEPEPTATPLSTY